jgi:hypothetical protein
MPPCEGCAAREAEITYLRAKVDKLEDRVLAAANPMVHAQVTGKGPGVDAQALEHFTDEQGVVWVTVAGKAFRLSEWESFAKDRGGYLDAGGKFIPADEYARVQSKIDEAFSGNGQGIDEVVNGSFRAV